MPTPYLNGSYLEASEVGDIFTEKDHRDLSIIVNFLRNRFQFVIAKKDDILDAR